MMEVNSWIGLVEQTREALANLRTEELEAIAGRAQEALAAGSSSESSDSNFRVDLRELAARHRVLGEVLEATEKNLAVLRRLRGRDEGSQWVR